MLTAGGLSRAQEAYTDDRGVMREVVVDERIKTIQLYREGWKMSYPILRLNEQSPLVLEFDELGEEIGTFSYRVVHCDADWRRSDMSEQQYMEGYFENQVRDYRTSFNTYYSYTHYTLQIPNEELQLKLSGNYLLVVYRDYDPSQVVFTKRFMVSEARVTINANAKRPVQSVYRDCCHEVDIRVEHTGYRIDDPFSETYLSIYQNGVWDFGIEGLDPLFVNPGELVYDYQDENVFMAGNEFRVFDTKNTSVRSYFVESITYVSPYFHFQLKPDEPNEAHLYFDREDINGKFYIESASGSQPELDADYVFVHFTLEMPLALADGKVYIAGALNNWVFNQTNRMEYNPDRGAYEATLLLKQGIYNYRYVFLPDDAQTFDLAEIEGSHYQTGNEYLVLFYHRPRGERYDHLVGHQVIHSNE
mgnify:CR=1 FL=1